MQKHQLAHFISTNASKNNKTENQTFETLSHVPRTSLILSFSAVSMSGASNGGSKRNSFRNVHRLSQTGGNTNNSHISTNTYNNNNKNLNTMANNNNNNHHFTIKMMSPKRSLVEQPQQQQQQQRQSLTKPRLSLQTPTQGLRQGRGKKPSIESTSMCSTLGSVLIHDSIDHKESIDVTATGVIDSDIGFDYDNDTNIVCGFSAISETHDEDHDVMNWTYAEVWDWLQNELLKDNNILRDAIRRVVCKFEMNYIYIYISGHVSLVLDQEVLESMGITKEYIWCCFDTFLLF